MFTLQRLKYWTIFDNINASDLLLSMALDPRSFPGISSEARQLKSSASTPSLRSRESSVLPSSRNDNVGGNVRVVVRVRGFLPRGQYSE